MILNTGFNANNFNNSNNNFVNNFNNSNNYESTIKNLEKAQGILDQRFSKKQISNEEYIRKSNEIKKDIEKYERLSGKY